MPMIARVVRADSAQLTAATSDTNIAGMRLDFQVPPDPFTIKVYVPTTLIEEVGAQAVYNVKNGADTVLSGFSIRSDAANDAVSTLFEFDIPNVHWTPTVGSLQSVRVTYKTSVVTSDVQSYAGDLFGSQVLPYMRIDTRRDGTDAPTVFIKQGYTGTLKVAIYEPGGRVNPVPVFIIHGGGAGRAATSGFQFQDPAFHRIAYGLARAGFRVFEPLLAVSPVAGCGNDAAVTAISALRTWAITNYGYASTCKVGFVGLSMGNVEALNWAWRNPTLTAGVAGVIPGTDLLSLRTRNPLSVQTAIDAAYTNEAGFLAVRADHDPVLNPTLIRPLNYRAWFSPDDFAALATEVIRDVKGAWGKEATSIPNNGHGVSEAWDASELVTWAENNFR